MHYQFFVTLDRRHAGTSEEARQYVFDTLTNEGFCAEGRWNFGRCDWFVIGGRWSGALSRNSWANSLYEQMDKAEQGAGVQVWGASYKDKQLQKKQHALEKLFTMGWQQHAPPEYAGIPIQRDAYNEDGYEDDAMILTEELYDRLLKAHGGVVGNEHFADLDDEAVSPAMIGNKWVVVVDYHR